MQAGTSGLDQFCMDVVRPNFLAEVLASVVLAGAVVLAGRIFGLH